MRGGALPMLAWATILTLSGTLNAIWTGDDIQIAMFGAAVLLTVLTAVVLILRRREALRPGEPSAPTDPEPVTHASYATLIAAVGFATLMFGLTFGHFIIYWGRGLMVAGLGRLLVELYHQRREVRPEGVVTATQILTLFATHWTLAPTVIAGCLLAAVLYLSAVARTHRWSGSRTAAFLAGLLVILVALDSGLDTYDDQLLSVHMVQHILLLDVAPPLLLTGRPLSLLLRSLPPQPRRSFGRGLVAVGRGAHPLLCLAIYTVILLAIHVPAFFDATLRSQPLHELEHVGFMVGGLIVWWPLLGSPGPRTRLGTIAHLLYITLAMAPMTLIGAYLDRDTTLFYPAYAAPAHALGISAVADQQQAGAVMWVAGTAVMALLGIVAVLGAMLEAERRQRVRDLHGVAQ